MTATLEKTAPKDAPKKDQNPGMPASLRAKTGAISIDPKVPVADVVDQFIEWLGSDSQRARFLVLNVQGGRPSPNQAISGLNPLHQRIVEVRFVIPR